RCQNHQRLHPGRGAKFKALGTCRGLFLCAQEIFLSKHHNAQSRQPESNKKADLDRPAFLASPFGHSVVSLSRLFSSVLTPIPLTSSKSSTEENGPFSSRYCTIARAFVAPIPTIRSCSA